MTADAYVAGHLLGVCMHIDDWGMQCADCMRNGWWTVTAASLIPTIKYCMGRGSDSMGLASACNWFGLGCEAHSLIIGVCVLVLGTVEERVRLHPTPHTLPNVLPRDPTCMQKGAGCVRACVHRRMCGCSAEAQGYPTWRCSHHSLVQSYGIVSSDAALNDERIWTRSIIGCFANMHQMSSFARGDLTVQRSRRATASRQTSCAKRQGSSTL